MDNSNSRTSHDVYLQLLPDHYPLLVTEPLFDIIKKALASSQDRSESAAQEIDSILSAHLESDVLEKASFEGQRCYEFFSKLLKVLLESALQIPIENEFLHARLAGIIIQVSKIEREEILERDQIYRWHELPEMWIGFEEKWHSIGPGGTEDQDWKRINFSQAILVGLNSCRPLSEASTSILRSWSRWGVIVLMQTLEGEYSDFKTKTTSQNPIREEEQVGWLETSEIWISKAGVEIYRSSGLEEQVGIAKQGEGPLWKEYLKENDFRGNRWKFWKERLRVLGDFEGSDEDIKRLSRSLIEKMEKIEISFQSEV